MWSLVYNSPSELWESRGLRCDGVDVLWSPVEISRSTCMVSWTRLSNNRFAQISRQFRNSASQHHHIVIKLAQAERLVFLQLPTLGPYPKLTKSTCGPTEINTVNSQNHTLIMTLLLLYRGSSSSVPSHPIPQNGRTRKRPFPPSRPAR